MVIVGVAKEKQTNKIKQTNKTNRLTIGLYVEWNQSEYGVNTHR